VHEGRFPSSRPETISSFEWNPRYRGYIFEAAQGCEFEVDRLTGCVVRYKLSFAGFPGIHDEDCPAIAAGRRAELGASVQDLYARYKPLRQAEIAGPAMTLICPAFDWFPNQMTDRLRLRTRSGELVLACRFQAFGYDDSGGLWLQSLYVDAVTGQPIGIYDEPRGNPTMGFDPGRRWTVSLDPSKTPWRLATDTKAPAFALRPVVAPVPVRSDGRCTVISSDKHSLCFEVDVKSRILWTGLGRDAKVWRAPKSAWAGIAASMRNLRPFPPNAAKSHGSG